MNFNNSESVILVMNNVRIRIRTAGYKSEGTNHAKSE